MIIELSPKTYHDLLVVMREDEFARDRLGLTDLSVREQTGADLRQMRNTLSALETLLGVERVAAMRKCPDPVYVKIGR